MPVRNLVLLGCTLTMTLGLAALVPTPAHAYKTIRDQFATKYVKPTSANPKDAAFRDAVEKAGCSVCHMAESKKRNVYGAAVGKFLHGKDNAKNPQKIQLALDQAAKMKSDPANAKSPTFGEIINSGRLPASKATGNGLTSTKPGNTRAGSQKREQPRQR